MGNFNRQSLEHLKKLCKLECEEAEIAELVGALDKVLAYVEQLSEVDTDGVAPCRFVLRGMSQSRVREDFVTDVLPRDKFLSNSPDQIGGMIRTPPVMKGNS